MNQMMYNKLRLPKRMSHTGYIMAAMIGSPFMTACNSSRYGVDNEHKPVLARADQSDESIHTLLLNDLKPVHEGKKELEEGALVASVPEVAIDVDAQMRFRPCSNIRLVDQVDAEKKEEAIEEAEDANVNIHSAATRGNLMEVQQILQRNPEALHSVDSNGNTPLHIAALMDHRAMVVYLINQQAINLNARNNDGHTPAHQAERTGNQELCDLLEKHHADFTIKCNHDITPKEALSNFLRANYNEEKEDTRSVG